MKKRSKKAEGFLGMGFGMIFSIFLIIIFIAIAFIAIKNFLDYKNCTITGIFLNELQSEITGIFNRQSSTIPFTRNLPTGIKYVCFANFSETLKGSYLDIGEDLSIYGGTKNNLFFYPRKKACGSTKTKLINNINISSITKNDNPYCIPVKNGKVVITISKGFNQGLITLS